MGPAPAAEQAADWRPKVCSWSQGLGARLRGPGAAWCRVGTEEGDLETGHKQKVTSGRARWQSVSASEGSGAGGNRRWVCGSEGGWAPQTARR